MTKTHLHMWSALMAVVGVVLMLGVSIASAAPTASAMVPMVTVTVTVTPTIMVRKNANGDLVTVGTVTPSAKPAATPAASSGGFLGWIVVGLALVLAAGATYWWLLLRRSTAHAGRRGARGKPQPDTHPQERRRH
ncbi:MAG: hypothetical protein ABI187_05755 [Ornithinibacter sp.]